MSAEFSDYRVLSVCTRDSQGCSYSVEEKSTGRLFVWEAIDYGLFTHEGKRVLLEEIRKLTTVTHQHLIQCSNYVDQPATGTLYLVKENSKGSVATLIKKCQATKSYIDEGFLWKILYQTARAAQAMYTRGPFSIVMDISPGGIHMDEAGDVKLDYWLAFREADAEKRLRRGGSSKDGSERRQKKSDTMALGHVLLRLASLENHPDSVQRIPAHYSEQIQEIINLMIHPEYDKRPTIESILYHPSLMSQVVTHSIQQMSLRSSKEQINTANLSNEKCVRCKELETKLAVMRSREANMKARETELKEQERAIIQRSKHIAMMEQLAKEKLDRAQVYLTNARKQENSGPGRPPIDLDSSCYSADPGDMYQVPTVAKMDPTKILKLPSLAPSISSRRSVRFDTIHEFEELKPLTSQQKWLENKRKRYKSAKVKCKTQRTLRISEKENEPPPLSEKDNASVLSLPHSTRESSFGLLETFFR